MHSWASMWIPGLVLSRGNAQEGFGIRGSPFLVFHEGIPSRFWIDQNGGSATRNLEALWTSSGSQAWPTSTTTDGSNKVGVTCFVSVCRAVS